MNWVDIKPETLKEARKMIPDYEKSQRLYKLCWGGLFVVGLPGLALVISAVRWW